MGLDIPYRHAVLAVMCLVPAAFRLWTGRSLRKILDDPLLPERLLAYRRRNYVVLWSFIAASAVVGALGDLAWTFPLALVARALAGYPLRRALYDERWSFTRYVVSNSRLLVALAGFRLLLAWAPWLVTVAGRFDWIAAIVICALLLFWHDRSADWFRLIVGSKPLEDGALLARFQALAAASTAPPPRFEMVDQRGGRLANAAALPSLRGSTVLYTDTALRLLDADEAAALTAHEIAHLEYYDTARLRKLYLMMCGLIVGASAAPLLLRLIPDLSLLMLQAVWLMLYVLMLAWIARDRQRNETNADLRAVKLSGDPEALVRALTKLHTFARVPRRWDTQMEQAASHPSLARRIRAIRAAAGVAPLASPTTAETLHSADGRTSITFADALHWQEAEGVLHVLPYGQLTELRLDARTHGATRLIAVERRGRRWEATLDADAAARVQAILDGVDGRLAEPAASRRTVPWLQAAGAIVAISAMWAGQIAVALVAISASIRSAATFFAAAGAAAVGAAALVGRQVIETGDRSAAWPALSLAVFGAAMLVGAWRKRDDDNNSRLVNAGMAGLAAVALFSVAAIAARGADAVRLYQASVALPSAAVLPLALAGALAIRPRRVWRMTAIPICLVGLLVGIAGSGTFLHAFGRDPFLVAAPPMVMQPLTGSPIADVTLPGMLSDVRLSPSGLRLALMKHPGGARSVTRFSVGRLGATFTAISATDLLFLDDDRVLTITVDGTRSRLQEVMIPSGAVTWERSIDDLAGPRLAYRRGSNRWVVTGIDDEGRIVAIEGAVGGLEFRRRSWPLEDREEAGEAWAIQGDTALRSQRTFDFDPHDAGAMSLTMAAMLDQTEMRLTRITPNGQTPVAVSRLDTMCTDHPLGVERLACMSYDGVRTHVLAMSPEDDAPQPIGSVSGRFLMSRPTRDGWMSGWMTTSSGAIDMSTQVAIDLVSRRAITVPPDLRADEITAVGTIAATLTHDSSSTRVRLYAIER